MKKTEQNNFDATLEYDGYLWLSDSSHPIVLKKQKLSPEHLSGIFPESPQIPFIVEGYLFADTKEKRSVVVKSIDGITRVYQVNLNEFAEESFTSETFFVDQARFQDIPGIKAVQYWESKPDILQPEYHTQTPTWVAFCGFASQP